MESQKWFVVNLVYPILCWTAEVFEPKELRTTVKCVNSANILSPLDGAVITRIVLENQVGNNAE